MGDMDGRGVLVAGGGRGIGRACAERLAECGAHVLISDPGVALAGSGPDEDVADAVVRAIRDHGGQATNVGASIGDAADGKRIVEACLAAHDRLDAVVVPATVIRDGLVEELTQRDWDDVLRVNLTGLFGLVRACLPHMRARGFGRIVTFTSRSGLDGRADGASNYAAAKMGVIGFTRSVAREVEGSGIMLNSIAARATTRASREVLDGIAARTGRQQPAPTIGGSEEIANLVVHLSSAACGVTGRVFWCANGELGVVPNPAPVLLSDGRSALGIPEIAALIADFHPAQNER